MADHKAPSQVTIAPYEEVSQLQATVTAFWKPALAVGLIIAAAIIIKERNQVQSTEAQTTAWASFAQDVPLASVAQGAELPEASRLQELATELSGTGVEAWAHALEIEELIGKRDWTAAEAALAEFETAFRGHPLLTTPQPVGADGATVMLGDHLRSFIKAERNFVATHPALYELPALPEGSPRVELETTAGTITLGLYEDRAPLHVENFIKLVTSGYYDGVKFHKVDQGQTIHAGDPNSKVGDPSTWGAGGPDYTVPAEVNDLFHFDGVLAAFRLDGDTDSNGSQFYITSGGAHGLDGKATVFGRILDGKNAIRVIDNSPLSPGPEGRPEDPITITKATLLE